MILTQANYLQQRDNIDWSRMPAALTDKPKSVTDTAAGKGWSGMGEQTQKATEQFFKLCNLLIGKDASLVMRKAKSPGRSKPAPQSQAANTSKAHVVEKKASPKGDSTLLVDIPDVLPTPRIVSMIATHTTFIKRYLTMHGKIKTRDQILSLLHGLQKAITEQRIGKDNVAIREIQKMQSELVALVGKMEERAKIEISEPYLSHYRQIAEGEEVRTSVKLLKQFIQMSGKSPDKAKAGKLSKKLAAALETVPREDVYRDELSVAAKAVAAYTNGSRQSISIPDSSLHGLGGLAGLGMVAGLGQSNAIDSIVSLLRAANVKDLSDASLRRAFSKTPAPGLCFELTKARIRCGTLSMADVHGIRAATISQSFGRRSVLAGMDLNESGEHLGIGSTEILGAQLAHYGASTSPKSDGAVDGRQATPIERLAAPPAAIQNPGPEKVTARDLAKLRFTTIGYNGRFKEVVGDPAVGFHMMVYGKPFQGKSSFVIELCKDLAALKKGRIAYLALEEGISASMQKKVIDRGAANVDGLDFLGTMPASFAGYSFIVIDSVSDRSMKRETLRELFLQNPQTCFICIFHATKEGSARGGLDYSHDMDIILKIEGHKPSVEKNRFI